MQTMMQRNTTARMRTPSFGARPVPSLVAQPRVLPRASDVRAKASLAKWDAMWDYLTENNMKTITPEEAAKGMASNQWVVVDVRPEANYEAAHIEGSVNVPMYKKLNPMNAGFGGAIKFIAYSLNGVAPVELNETFVEDIKKAAEGGKKGVILACEAGGTLRPSTNFSKGKASRSLQATFRALNEAGLSKAAHLERGLYGWYQADLPFTGDYKPDVGRTPSAAADPTLKVAASSGGYQMRPDDKK